MWEETFGSLCMKVGHFTRHDLIHFFPEERFHDLTIHDLTFRNARQVSKNFSQRNLFRKRIFLEISIGDVAPYRKIYLRDLRRRVLRGDADIRGRNSKQGDTRTFARVFSTAPQLRRDVRFLRSSCDRRDEDCVEVRSNMSLMV